MLGLTSSDWIAIAIFVLSAVGGALCWLVQRFFASTDEKLERLCDFAAKHSAYREGDRRDIDRAHTRLDQHDEKLDAHALAIAKNVQPGAGLK